MSEYKSSPMTHSQSATELRQRRQPSTPSENASRRVKNGGSALSTPNASCPGLETRSSSNGKSDKTLKSRLKGVLRTYSPSRILAEEQTHAIEAKLEVVTKGESVNLKYLDDSGATGSLTPEELCAISVVVYDEPHREAIEGQIMLVKRAHSLTKAEWGTWVRTFLLCLSNYFFLTLVVGPITALVLLFVVIAFRKEIDVYLAKEYEIDHETLTDIKSWTGFLGLWINVVLPCYRHSTSALLIWLLISSATMLLFSKPILSLFTVPEHFRYIRPTYPIVMSYRSQAKMQDLLETRAKIVAVPRLFKKVRHLSVGSYWAETVLSVLVYHDVYNSRHARKFCHLFLTYVLPVIFAFQLLYTIWPHITYGRAQLVRSVRADYGVVLVDQTVRSFSNMIRWPELPLVLQEALDFVGNLTHWATAWVAYVTSFIVPIDESITYIKAKFEPMRRMAMLLFHAFHPLFNLLALMIYRSHALVSPMIKLVVLFMRRVVQPAREAIKVTATRPVHEVRALMNRYLGFPAANRPEIPPEKLILPETTSVTLDRLLISLPTMAHLDSTHTKGLTMQLSIDRTTPVSPEPRPDV